ncbi:restriction endonuclease subunit S [Cyanobium gracile]|nr:restriction endonuclease subunit S [Cyanobium gracile]
MDNVEAHTMRLLGSSASSEMKSASVHFQSGDVLYGRLRPYLNKVISPAFEGLASAEFIPLTMPTGIDPRFVQYRLNAADFVAYASHLDEGDRPRVDYNQIGAFSIGLPPSSEQHRIVEAIESYLTRLDDAMATLERVQRNLKRYRALVLKAAVEGRLVPTDAELARAEGRQYERASVLLERILAERRRRWEEGELAKMKAKGKVPKNDNWKAKYVEPTGPHASELPELPVGWCWASMDQLTARITSGSRDWTQYYDRGDSIFLMAQNVRPGFLDLTHKQFVDPPLEDTSCERSQVRANDLLVTIVGANTGDVCRVPVELSRHYVCQSVALMRPVEPSSSHYIHFYLNSAAGQAAYANFMYGQGRPHLSFDNLRETVIPLPPLGEQIRIHEVIEQKLSVAEEVSGSIFIELLRCTRLRQSILKWAFEGRLVDQDPSDEPAEVLLERIREERAASRGKKPPRPRRVNTRSASA